MKIGKIKIGDNSYNYSFSMLAVENVLMDLHEGDIQSYIEHLFKVNEKDQKELGLKLTKTLRTIAFRGIEDQIRISKSNEELPFSSADEIGLYVKSIDAMVDCYADFNDAFYSFFLKGEETPKATPKAKATRSPKTKSE